MPGARAAQGASPGGVPCPACEQRAGGPEAPVSLALEEAPGSQRRGQHPHCSASTLSSSSPSRRRPRSSLRSLTAPCPCPAQSQWRCPGLASAPDSYPTLGGPPCSAAAAHGDERPGNSGPRIFFFRRGKAAPGRREEMPESGASRGGRPPPSLRLVRRRVARGTSGLSGDCTPEGYFWAPSWKAEQGRPGSGAVAASDPALTGKLPEEGFQPHRPALPSPGPTPNESRWRRGRLGRKWPLAVCGCAVL